MLAKPQREREGGGEGEGKGEQRGGPHTIKHEYVSKLAYTVVVAGSTTEMVLKGLWERELFLEVKLPDVPDQCYSIQQNCACR